LVVSGVVGLGAGAAALLTPRLDARSVSSEPPLRPWGRLSHVAMHLEQPPQNVRPTDCLVSDPVWRLPQAHTPSQALALFRGAEIDADDAEALLAATRSEDGGCRTTPPRDVVERLPSQARSRLYERLGQVPENPFHAFPFTRPEDDPRWAQLTLIVGDALLSRLEWRRGGQVHLTDFEVLCRAADSDTDRIAILEAISRMSGTLAWITVQSDDPLEPLLRYWGRSARTRDLQPILEAVARVPGGGQLDVMHLLPPFARRRLNTFPRAGDPPRDCFWTALHFFNVTTPPDDFAGAQGTVPILERDYEPVSWDARTFGDVILFLDREGTLIHAANHIADDLVFTKNGYHPRRPWTLLALDEVRELYPEATELRAFHLRTLPEE
jgi:hypothetical protein